MMDEIPREILHQILDYVFENPFKNWILLLVNSEWFTYGVRYVWAQARSSDLLAVPTHRRQIYATLVSKLEVHADDKETNRQLVDLDFPRLVNLFLYRQQPNLFSRGSKPFTDIASLHQFLSSGLCVARLTYVADAELLLYLQTHCPCLEDIRLIYQGPEFPMHEIVDGFFRALPSLRKVDMRISEFNPPPLVSSTLVALANLPRLIELKLDQDLDKEVIELARISTLSSPFPVLDKLSLNTYPSALPSIARAFGEVRCLSLRLQGIVDPEDYPEDLETGGNALRHLSKMTWLRELEIISLGWWACEADDLLCLKNLSQLTKLSFHCGEQAPIEVRGFTDANLVDLFSSLVRLRTISLGSISGWEFTTAWLAVIGQSCPFLQSCDLERNSFNLLQLQHHQTPLFPNLKSLTIGELTNEDGIDSLTGKPIPTSPDPRDHAVQIALHFPKLEPDQLYCENLGFHQCSRGDSDPDHDFQCRVLDHLKLHHTRY